MVGGLCSESAERWRRSISTKSFGTDEIIHISAVLPVFAFPEASDGEPLGQECCDTGCKMTSLRRAGCHMTHCGSRLLRTARAAVVLLRPPASSSTVALVPGITWSPVARTAVRSDDSRTVVFDWEVPARVRV